MEVKIITGVSPEELEKAINKFLESMVRVKTISYAIGAYPNGAEFSVVILFEK